MGRAKAQRALAGRRKGLRLCGKPLGMGQQIFRVLREPLAGGGQPDGLSRPVEQGRAQPFLQGANTTTECGLRHVSILRGPREITGVGKNEEVFQPGEVHS